MHEGLKGNSHYSVRQNRTSPSRNILIHFYLRLRFLFWVNFLQRRNPADEGAGFETSTNIKTSKVNWIKIPL